MEEAWEDGQSFAELNRRHAQLQQRRAELEAARRAMTKRKKQHKKRVESATDPSTLIMEQLELAAADESLRVQQQLLKRHEGEWAAESTKLKQEKALLLKELKRYRDERREPRYVP